MQTEAQAAAKQVQEFISLLEDNGSQVVRPDAPLVKSLRTLLRVVQSVRTGA
jgi:hypothetical protein